ncbi:MAG TPA: hypothetical protein PLI57_01095 [Spirochaetota bacterium]|nr:hypothetical protein [Spirochaetota bacterium]
MKNDAYGVKNKLTHMMHMNSWEIENDAYETNILIGKLFVISQKKLTGYNKVTGRNAKLYLGFDN